MDRHRSPERHGGIELGHPTAANIRTDAFPVGLDVADHRRHLAPAPDEIELFDVPPSQFCGDYGDTCNNSPIDPHRLLT
jgi:hypothetical protein